MVEKNQLTNGKLLSHQGKENVSGRDGQAPLILCDVDTGKAGQLRELLLREPQLLPDLQNLGCSSFVSHDEVPVTHIARTCQVQKSTMNERLSELKKRRKALGLKQEDLAAWIGKERATYTRKEKGDFPITIEEWDIIEGKLTEIELEKSRAREVVPPCGILDRDHVETICRKIGVIYASGNEAAINSLECHLEGLVSMITNREVVTEILNSLNILMNDNLDFHRRLNAHDKEFGTIKN